MMKKIPEWAPKSLTQRYKIYLENENTIGRMDKIDCDMIYRLITVPKMGDVWKRLYKNRARSSLDAYNRTLEANENMAHRLFYAASYANRDSQRKIKTRTEDRDEYLAIAETARAFIEKIINSGLDSTPYRYYPLEAINTIIKNDLNPEKMHGHYCLSEDIDDFHTKGGIYSEFRAKDLDGNDICEHWRIAENTKDWFDRGLITPQYPTISKIINELAREADFLAKEVTNQDKVAERPSIGKSTLFIRLMYGEFWFKEFGGPLYRTFAHFCRIALNDESIGESTVKDALRDYTLPKDRYSLIK